MRKRFGSLEDGRNVDLVTLTGANGIEVRAISYGAIITSILAPDRDERIDDIVLGFEDLESYVRRSPYFGAVVGRYANRIAAGSFDLDGIVHHVTRNEGDNCLHGGAIGFDKVIWQIDRHDERSVKFTHVSPNGDEGFPGELRVAVTYSLLGNDLIVDYEATTDAPTVVNLTQHTYWNLSAAGDVLDHYLTLAASQFTPVESSLIPTGEIARVDETPFDFRRSTRIGSGINDPHPQLEIGRGYDHNFVLDRESIDTIVARLHDRRSGRTLAVRTTEPGLQLYTGNHLDGRITGKDRAYVRHAGLCLETQHYPDSPNRPQFPSTILRPPDVYESRTIFTFGTD